jgi:hypothetical protein
MFCAPKIVLDGTEGVGSRLHVLRSWTRFGRYQGRQIPFSCFGLLDLFRAIPRASGLDFMLCTLDLILGCTEGVGSNFHVLRSVTHFRRYGRHRVLFSSFVLLDSFLGGTGGVGSRFHVLRFQIRFRRYRGRRVPFLCFALPNSFWDVLKAPGPVFMFGAHGLIFGSTEGVMFHFHVL